MTDLFQKNLGLLGQVDAYLARRVQDMAWPDGVQVVEAKDGQPVPQVQGIFLHSAYYPQREAEKFVAGFAPASGAATVVFGLGFGYHVRELLRRLGENDTVSVIEPSLAVFRAFLGSVDLHEFIPRVRFWVAESPEKLLARQDSINWDLIVHPPSARIFPDDLIKLQAGLELNRYLQKKSLRVLVVPPIYGGSLPTARYCAEALEHAGHHVEWVECEKFADGFFAVQKVTPDKGHAEILSTKFMEMMGETVIAKAVHSRPDLILVMAQAPLTPSILARLRGLGVPMAFWFVEDFRTLKYWKDVATAYDHFFTIQRGEFFDELEALGVKDYYYLPQACHTETHKPLVLSKEERERYGADLSFIGAAYYNRVKSFPRLVGYDFKIWGTDWEKCPILDRLVQEEGRRMSSEESGKIFNAAKINLNLHSSTFHEGVNPHGDFVNPRTFEIAACRAFQLVDERSDLSEFFDVGREVATFRDLDDLKVKIEHYLGHEEERRRIADNAYGRIKREHSMHHRMTELLLHVFSSRIDWLKPRVEQRQTHLEFFIESAGPATDLGLHLEKFRDSKDFTLKTAVEQISQGEGALNDNELLLLMVDQVIKDKT